MPVRHILSPAKRGSSNDRTRYPAAARRYAVRAVHHHHDREVVARHRPSRTGQLHAARVDEPAQPGRLGAMRAVHGPHREHHLPGGRAAHSVSAMTDDEAFIRAIVDHPGEDLPRSMYADWLE